MKIFNSWIVENLDDTGLFSLCLKTNRDMTPHFRPVMFNDKETGIPVVSGPFGLFSEEDLLKIRDVITDYFGY